MAEKNVGRAFVAVLAAATVFTAPGARVHAQPLVEGPPSPSASSTSLRMPDGKRLGAWLELGMTSGGPDGSSVVAFTPEVGLRYRVAESVVADVSWGLVVARTQVAAHTEAGGRVVSYDRKITRVEPGNPILHGAFSPSFGDDLRLEVGLGVAVPTASRAEIGSERDPLSARHASEVAHRAALAMRGYWSPWRWAPERFALFLPIRVDVPIVRAGPARAQGMVADIGLAVEADLAVGLMLPVLGDQTQEPDFIVQGALGIGGRVAGPLCLGVRVRAVGAATGAVVPDDLVSSAEPWVRLRFDPAHLQMRASLTLNGTDGLGQARGPSYGLFVSGGGEFD